MSLLLSLWQSAPPGTLLSSVVQYPYSLVQSCPGPPCTSPKPYLALISSPEAQTGRLYTDFSIPAKRYDFLSGRNGSITTTLMLFNEQQQVVWGNLKTDSNDVKCTTTPILRPPLSTLNGTIYGLDDIPPFGICNRTAGNYDGYEYVLWTRMGFPILFVVKTDSVATGGFVRFYFGNDVVVPTDPIVFKPPTICNGRNNENL